MGGDAEFGGVVDLIKPLVERLLAACDIELHFCAVVVATFAFVGVQKLLRFDREAGVVGLGCAELLEFGFRILSGDGCRFVIREPLHFIGDFLGIVLE